MVDQETKEVAVESPIDSSQTEGVMRVGDPCQAGEVKPHGDEATEE